MKNSLRDWTPVPSLNALFSSCYSITEAVCALWHWVMDSLSLTGKCRKLYDVLQQAQKWERFTETPQWISRKNSLDEPELQPRRLNQRENLNATNQTSFFHVIRLEKFFLAKLFLLIRVSGIAPENHQPSLLGWVKLNNQHMTEPVITWIHEQYSFIFPLSAVKL